MINFSNPKSEAFTGKRGGMSFNDAMPRTLVAKLKAKACNLPKLCPGWNW